MKGIFLILFIFSALSISAQYNPALNPPVTNSATSYAQGNPSDGRSYYYDAVNFVYRPYVSTTEVLTYLNLAKYRTGQFDIVVNTGGTLNAGVITGGANAIWFFKNGTTNGDLVLKSDVQSVNGRQGAVITLNSDSLKKYPIDTSASPRNNYLLTFDSILHKWKLTAPPAAYVAGTGILISGNTISGDNTTALWNASTLRGRSISITAPNVGNIYKWNGVSWIPSPDLSALDTAYFSNDTLYLVGNSDTSIVVLNDFNVLNDHFNVAADSLGTIHFEVENTDNPSPKTGIDLNLDSISIHADNIHYTQIVNKADSLKLIYANNAAVKKYIKLDTTAITIVDNINSFGQKYGADYSANGKANPRWLPDIEAVRSAIHDSSGNYIKNDTTIVQNGGFKLGAGSKIAADSLKINNIAPNAISEPDYEIDVFPDLQNMTQFYPAVEKSMFDWIINNKTTENIKAVMQVGDLTNDATTVQYDTVSHQFNRLDSLGLQYATAIGNHDYDGNDPAPRLTTQFNAYFGASRYSSKPWFGGSFNGGYENAYQFLDIQSHKFIVFNLEFFPRDTVISWAQHIIDSVHNRDVIIILHGAITALQQESTDAVTFGPNFYSMTASNSSIGLWRKFLRINPQIKFVINGHFLQSVPVGGAFSQRITDAGNSGNVVNQLFVNYQTDANGGNGFFMRMKFKPSVNKVSISYFSPYLNRSDSNRTQNYVLNYPDISINGSVGIGGGLYVNGESRVDSALYLKNGPLLVNENSLLVAGSNKLYVNGASKFIDSVRLGVVPAAANTDSLLAKKNDGTIVSRSPSDFGIPLAIGNSITNSTKGSVLYAGTNGFLQQSNSALYWDSLGKALGINTSSPLKSIDIRAGSFGLSNIALPSGYPRAFEGGFNSVASIVQGSGIYGLSITRASAGIAPPWLLFYHTFGSDPNVRVSGSALNQIGGIAFNTPPSDTTNVWQAARILCIIDSVKSTYVASSLNFSVTTGVDSIQTTKLRINSNGNIVLCANSSSPDFTDNGNNKLQVQGSAWIRNSLGIGVVTPLAALHIVGTTNGVQSLLQLPAGQSQTNPITQIVSSSNDTLYETRAQYSTDVSSIPFTNLFLGKNSGKNNTIGTTSNNGAYNVAIGGNAMAANTTGRQNFAAGSQALFKNTTGGFHVAIGGNAVYANQTASNFTGIGQNTLDSVTAGGDAIAIGQNSCNNVLSSTEDVAVGDNSLEDNGNGTSGGKIHSFNVAIGQYAGRNTNATLTQNVFIGHSAGRGIATAGQTVTGNVLIGYQAARNINNISNRLYIANSSTTTPLIYGEFNNNILATPGSFGIGTQAPGIFGLNVNRSARFNQDSTTTISVLGSNLIVTIDTITGKLNKIYPLNLGLPIHGNSTTTGTATTVVTVTIGSTMANTNYFVGITPQDLLTAVNYYISAKTTTTFDITFVSALTGSINFDWSITP